MDAPEQVIFTITTISLTSVLLEWDTVNADGYTVERSLDAVNWDIIAQLGSHASEYTDTGLLNSTIYHYRITAYNRCGSSISEEQEIETDCTDPTTPYGLHYTYLSSTSVKITWSDLSNSSSYTLEYSVTSGSGFATLALIAVGVKEYIHNISVDDCFYYRVTAHRCGVDSPTTDEIGPVCGQCISPSAPIGLVAIPVSEVKVNLSWNAPAVGVVDDYLVKQNDVTIATVTNTSYSVTGLTPNTAYCFQVVARNVCGTSPEDEACTTTNEAVPCYTPEQTFSFIVNRTIEPGHVVVGLNSSIYLRHSNSFSIDVTNPAIQWIVFDDSSDLDDVLMMIPYGESVIQTFDNGSSSASNYTGRGDVTFTIPSPCIIMGATGGFFVNGQRFDGNGNMTIRNSVKKTFIEMDGNTPLHTVTFERGNPPGVGAHGSGHTSDFEAAGFTVVDFYEGFTISQLESAGYIYNDITTGKKYFQFRFAHVVCGAGHVRLYGMNCSDSAPSSSSCGPQSPVVLTGNVVDSTVTLNWTSTVGELGYLLQRSVDGGDWDDWDDLPADVTTFSETINLTQEYCYRVIVRACITENDSDPSNEFCYYPSFDCDDCCPSIKITVSDRTYFVHLTEDCVWESDCGDTLIKYASYWELNDYADLDCAEFGDYPPTSLSLYNTGQEVDGDEDAHWEVATANGAFSFMPAKIITGSILNLYAERENAGWIGIDADAGSWFVGGGGDDGIRAFRTTINLPAPMDIVGRLAVDNYVVSLKVNTVDILDNLNPDMTKPNNWRGLVRFTIPASAFTAGENTIDFGVQDSGVFGGLLVEWLAAIEPNCHSVFRVESSASCPPSAGWELISSECDADPEMFLECVECPDVATCCERYVISLDYSNCIDGDYVFTKEENRWVSGNSTLECTNSRWILTFNDVSDYCGECIIQFWADITGSCPPTDISEWHYSSSETDCNFVDSPLITAFDCAIECPTGCCECDFTVIMSGTASSCDVGPIQMIWQSDCHWEDVSTNNTISCEDGFWHIAIYAPSCSTGCYYEFVAPKAPDDVCPPESGWIYQEGVNTPCNNAAGDYVSITVSKTDADCEEIEPIDCGDCSTCCEILMVTFDNSGDFDGDYPYYADPENECEWTRALPEDSPDFEPLFQGNIECSGEYWVLSFADIDSSCELRFTAPLVTACPPETGWTYDPTGLFFPCTENIPTVSLTCNVVFSRAPEGVDNIPT